MKYRLTKIIVIFSIFISYSYCFSGETRNYIWKREKYIGTFNDFSNNQEIFLPNPKQWSQFVIDNGIKYRKIKSKCDFLIVAGDIDKRGFCNNDVILEITFRDDLKPQRLSPSSNWVNSRPVIESRVDFIKDDEYLTIGHLPITGDGEWKTSKIFIEKTPFQLLRAINDTFSFSIKIGNSFSVGLPISTLKIYAVEHSEFVKLREIDRKNRGLERVDYECPIDWKSKLEPILSGKDFLIWQTSTTELVFPQSPCKKSLYEPLRCFEIAGESEAVSFVVRPLKNIENFDIQVSDLEHFGQKIDSNNIKIKRVIYNDQRWGWGWSKKYGVCPDYLISYDSPLALSPDKNIQFWLDINIPLKTSAGLYKGTISFYSNEKLLLSLPINVEVFKINFQKNKIKHLVFHSPFFKDYHRNPIVIFKDMKKHGLEPIFYPKSGHYKSPPTLNPNLKDFRKQITIFRSIYTDTNVFFFGLQDFSLIWYKLQGPEPAFQYYFPEFEKKYSGILKKYATEIRSFELIPYITFIDEPGENLDRRRRAYLSSYIAQKSGLKTWVDSYISSDKQLKLSAGEKVRNVNYLRPLSEVIDVFVCPLREISEKNSKIMKEKNTTLTYVTTYLSSNVRPVYNRLLHGIYPFIVESKFVSCYTYRDGITDPYDDMDCDARHYNRIGMNDYLLTYPSWDGTVVTTLSYEALKEGVEDSMLISTLQYYIYQAKSSKDQKRILLAKKADSYLMDIFSRLSRNFTNHYLPHYNSGPNDLTAKKIVSQLNKDKEIDYEVFNKIRYVICKYIVELN